MGIGYNDDKVKNEENDNVFANDSSKNDHAGKCVNHEHKQVQKPKYKAYKNDLQEKWTYVWHGVDGI